MLVLSGADVRAALPMTAAIGAMREAFTELARGNVAVPLRTSLSLPERGAVVLVMPGRVSAGGGLGAKVVSVFPQNVKRGVPLLHAAVLLLDPETGDVAALVEGRTLTALRTGAASGLATDLLARPDARCVAVIGSGAQARAQLEAVCAVRSIERALVYSRTAAHAERFASEMTRIPHAPSIIVAAPSPKQALRDADVVCVATSSRTPVLEADWVSPGAHVNAVGSFTREMREVDPALLERAAVVVDQREAALAEAGEVIAAVRDRLIDESSLIELGAVVTGAVTVRQDPEDITVFKSVGLAVQDLVAGMHAVRAAREKGLGREVEL